MSPLETDIPRILPLQDKGWSSSAGKAFSMYA